MAKKITIDEGTFERAIIDLEEGKGTVTLPMGPLVICVELHSGNDTGDDTLRRGVDMMVVMGVVDSEHFPIPIRAIARTLVDMAGVLRSDLVIYATESGTRGILSELGFERVTDAPSDGRWVLYHVA